MMLWLLACASPRWTAEDALGAHLAALDTDGNGRVDEPEYDRARWQGPPFASVDTDGDGALSAAELVTIFASQSPTAFDGGPPQEAARLGAQAWSYQPGQQYVWEVLVWMGDALGHAGRPTPPADLVEAAVRSGDIQSPDSLRALASIEPAWRAAGWAWPAGMPTRDAATPEGPVAAPDANPSAAVTAHVRDQLAAMRTGHSPAASTASPGVQ